MSHGSKPTHRRGEAAFKKYMERFPPSLHKNYTRIRTVIAAYGKGKIEWYYLRRGETRFRTKDRPGQRGKIFAWVCIYNGWLCLGLPEHDPAFQTTHRQALRTVAANYRNNFWYGKGQVEVALDVGDPDFEKQLQHALQLAQAALTATG